MLRSTKRLQHLNVPLLPLVRGEWR
jgi:hypothetical protein